MAPAPATIPTKPSMTLKPVPDGMIAPAIPALGEVAPALALRIVSQLIHASQ